MSCQSETWNLGHDECKHKSRSATNFDGNSSAEKRKYSLTSWLVLKALMIICARRCLWSTMFIIKFISLLRMNKEASSSGDEVADREIAKFPFFPVTSFFHPLRETVSLKWCLRIDKWANFFPSMDAFVLINFKMFYVARKKNVSRAYYQSH